MTSQALSTIPRPSKGLITPPPVLEGRLRLVADAFAGRPEAQATAHRHPQDRQRVHGVNFYVGSDSTLVRTS